MTVTAVSPFALEIEWNIPTLPNGAITNYTIYTNSVSIDSVNGSHTSYVYNGLSPYQEVSVSVSASTAVGEGPQSIETTTRTRESGLNSKYLITYIRESVDSLCRDGADARIT